MSKKEVKKMADVIETVKDIIESGAVVVLSGAAFIVVIIALQALLNLL